MSNFFFSSNQETSENADKKGGLSGLHKMLLISILGVASLCYLVTDSAQNASEITYRIVMFVFTGVYLTLLYYVDKKKELEFSGGLLIVFLIIVQTFLTHLFFSFVSSQPSFFKDALQHDITSEQILLILPYALAPSIVSAMFGRELGVYIALCTSFFGFAVIPLDCSSIIFADYLVISLLAGMTGVLLCSQMRKRESFIHAGVITGAVVFSSIFILSCFKNNGLYCLQDGFHFSAFIWEALAAMLASFFVAVFTGGIMPMLEKLCSVSTHIKCLEWSDEDDHDLREMERLAPGTYHHCKNVERLAKAAADIIPDADAALTKACALYHDIGKMKNPQYFTENNPDKSQSPHNELTPEASARIIRQHVQDGIELAQKKGLDPRIISVIREHHGKSIAGYNFYLAAKEKYKEAKAKYDEGLIDTCPEEINEEHFKYKGPLPQTKESGIISMADIVESAIRSILKDYSEQAVRNEVNKLIDEKVKSGHLDESKLTLGDIKLMKESFIHTLLGMNHTRIAYTKRPDEDTAPEKEQTATSAGAEQEKAAS